jgi:CheY-like chemotaxis protein
VAYAIVQEHGGRIRLESREGGGASFFIELPVSGKLPAAVASEMRLAPSAARSVAGAAILVVEDEAALATAVVDALQDAGYVADWAPDGEQALASVNVKAYDLVICDMKMPKLDGMAFHRSLLERAPALARRVVFVTGDVAGTAAEKFLSESGCGWLAKPFRLGDLMRAVREGLS